MKSKSLSLVLLLASCATVAIAPGPVSAQQAPSNRADALKEVIAKITDPDAETRIANFEALAEEGDSTKLNIAIRTAVASDDPMMRALGFRAYVAMTKSIPLEIVLTPEETKALREAEKSQNGMDSLQKNYPYLTIASKVSFVINIYFDQAPFRSVSGMAYAGEKQRNSQAEYAMRGDRVTFRARSSFRTSDHFCSFDLKPTKAMVIEGMMRCEGYGWRPLAVRAPMF